MDTMLALLGFVLAAAVAAAIIYFPLRSAAKARARASYDVEELAYLEQRATVTGKQAGLMKVPGGRYATTRFAWVAYFRPDTGEELMLEVGQDLYGEITVGARDVLVTRDGYFVGLGRVGATGFVDEDAGA